NYNLEEYETSQFQPILEESKILKQEIKTIFKSAVDIETNISEIANNGDYDLLLVGLGKSIFEGTFLGKILGFTNRIINPDRLLDKFIGKEGFFENSPFDERTRQIISRTKMPLGILIDRELQNLDKVFVPILSSEDSFLMDYAQKLIFNNNSRISVLDINHTSKTNFVLESALTNLESKFPDNISLFQQETMRKEFFSKQDLMIISIESWKKLLESGNDWLEYVPSVLIVKG
ncbi:MAG: cation/H(+) antiporter, partial [Flavobacterium sp.]|nr:cation/H(+) antiporter [Flavobacterium sp.]